ncbi:glycerophosphodiester phosphodiesterase [Lactobacillus sp. LL6]|uniref:glycerophosphoryl diester phosphodiesterase membrane domain-containing protein n=1 Tax=Lactobacillus sp. LL6 TaxID=2596827 RepID=UPI001184F620|nr:glycerophosphodiester phosphodiesterase [Lactobacillus sp. LL6]TSO25614.1 glycerophosphodiester phosphodiesterase [Lactobacillus sp. LL6]
MNLKDIQKYSRNFKEHYLQYIMLFLGIDLISQFIVIPIFRYLTTYILQAGAIPFVSYQNVMTIITTHTMVFMALIIELILLMVIIYAEFACLLIGIRDISLNKFNIRTNIKQTIITCKKVRPSSLALLIAYFIFIIPFADIIYRTPLLSKIQIPEFILDYMTRNGILITILIVFYLTVGVLGMRLILTLPIMIFDNKKTWSAMKESWNKTANFGWCKLLIKLVILLVMTMLLLIGFYCSLYILQLVWDVFPGKLPEILAVVNLTTIQLVSELILIWSSVVAFLILFKFVDLNDNQVTSAPKPQAITIGVIIIGGLLIGAAITTNILYLNGKDSKAPIVVSHRGVSNENGVQNTIPALKKTAKMKPDYVEIDLHETRDKQFIVLHDENLKKLTGINKTPSQLTLKQLTKLTARENGHAAKLASFDQYLREAEKLHQKLLIEIKTTPNDSKKMLERFNKKYGKVIIKNHYKVQSLDYRVIEGLHEINPRLDVMYIQPYNFTYPKSNANGYSMEYSTLNSDFIWQSHLNHHPVYAWTVNDANLMKKLMFDHVDGVITDDLPEVKTAIEDFQNNSTYANRILNYILVLPTYSNLEV